MKTTIKSAMLAGIAGAALLATAASVATAASCTNDTWNKIMSSGKITVGVKPDYKPWGFRDPSGKLIGMEVDMAQDVADTMGVKLELVPVESPTACSSSSRARST